MVSSSTWSLVSQIILVVTSQLRREGEIASLCEAQAGTDEAGKAGAGREGGITGSRELGPVHSTQCTVHRSQYTERGRH